MVSLDTGTSGAINPELNILKQINKSMGSINSGLQKSMKLNMSGITGQQSQATEPTEQTEQQTPETPPIYEEVMVEGQRMIAETDAKTGKINDLLTINEASQQGILNETGKIKKELTKENSQFDKITSHLKDQEGLTNLTKSDLMLISTETYKEVELQHDINLLLGEIKAKYVQQVRELGGKASDFDKTILENYFGSRDESFYPLMSTQGGVMPQGVVYGTDTDRLFWERTQELDIPFLDISHGDDAI